MKIRLLVLLQFVCECFVISNAQITTLGAPIKMEEKKEIPVYDSLTNFDRHKNKYDYLIGQKVYVVHNKVIDGLSRFVFWGGGWNGGYDLEGHYLTIIDPVEYRKSLDEFGYDHSYHHACYNIAFQDDESGVVYYYDDEPISLNTYLVVVGHFEKMKQLYEGQEFIFVSDDTEDNNYSKYYQNGIFYLNTRQRIKSIKYGTAFTCTGVSIDDQYDWEKYKFIESRVVILLHNEKLGDCYCYAISEDMYNGRSNAKKYILGKFLSPEDYHKKQKADALAAKAQKEAELAKAEKQKERELQEQRRIQILIDKYGQDNINLAKQRRVKIGWNQELCKEAWGEPKSINKTTTSYGVHEQWVYLGNKYLYFDNGILVSIQE